MAVDPKEDFDLQKLAEHNPKVDLDKVRNIQDMIKRLREAGVTRSEYGLGSPFARKPRTSSSNWRRP